MGDRPAHDASDGEGVVHDIFGKSGSMVAIALYGQMLVMGSKRLLHVFRVLSVRKHIQKIR